MYQLFLWSWQQDEKLILKSTFTKTNNYFCGINFSKVIGSRKKRYVLVEFNFLCSYLIFLYYYTILYIFFFHQSFGLLAFLVFFFPVLILKIVSLCQHFYNINTATSVRWKGFNHQKQPQEMFCGKRCS